MKPFCRWAVGPADTKKVPPRGKRNSGSSIVDIFAELVFGDGNQRIRQVDRINAVSLGRVHQLGERLVDSVAP